MPKPRFLQDLSAYSQGSFWRALSTIIFNTNYRAICNYRIAHFFYKIKLIPICKLIMCWNRTVHSIDIDYRANLAGGFRLMHGIGVVIEKNVRTLGKATIYQQVTLGGNNGKTKIHPKYGAIAQPILEDGVTVCTGACCFGPIVLGQNSTIGAMTVCTHDISENSVYFTKAEHVLKENNT